MDPMAEEQLDYGDEEYAGAQKMQYEGGGAISALADDEIVGEDDEYDDLYNDVNVGEGFLQLQRQESTTPAAGVGSESFKQENSNHLEPKEDASTPQQLRIHEPKEEVNGDRDIKGNIEIVHKGNAHGIDHNPQTGNVGFQGSAPQPRNVAVDSTEMSVKVSTEATPMLSSGTGGPGTGQQMPTDQMGMTVNANVGRPMVHDNQIRPALEDGGAMLLVGELHWWTTDAELESVLSQYGKVKEIKFFDERASGKSKGYCQVEFHDSAAAAACKEGMDGHVFNGRPCVVTFASPQTIRQMATAYTNKNPAQPQSQSQPQLRRPMNDGIGRGGGMNQTGGDAGRGYGRGGWVGRGGQGILNRGPGGGGHMRGRGGPMGGRNNMLGNNSGIGGNGGAYGQGLGGPGFGGPPGGLMHPQGMMGAGFDPTYMGRGGGYGGFQGPPFPGMLPQFPNAMGLPGVAPHVNPAFFGRGMVPNGMGMMGPTGMEGPHGGMWTDTSMGGWGGDEHGQRTRESSYGGEDNASEYGYGGEASQEKGGRSSAVSKEKERGYEREVSGNSEKRNRDEREVERDRSDRDHRYREEKDSYRGHRHREREADYEDDWDRGHSSRSRSRSKAVPEDDHRRSRDVDYRKRRRPSE